MKLEILKDFQHKGQDFVSGEVRVVDDATGEYFCRAGWGKDLAGVIATGNPGPADVVLEVQDAVNPAVVSNAG